MAIRELIESIGLSTEKIREYLEAEIEEFLQADDLNDQIEEFHDIIFSLKNLAYTHTGKHLEIEESRYIDKMQERLRDCATVSQTTPNFKHKSIAKIPIGVVHIAFGNFKQPWSHFDPFKNGTEAEIAMLTDNDFRVENNQTNHLIVTFDEVHELEYSLLTSGWNQEEQNCVLLRIPNFLFSQAKQRADFNVVEQLLSYQLYAGLKRLSLKKDSIIHFHSWEAGVALRSKELKGLIEDQRTIFSPYLTVSRLREFVASRPDRESTLSKQELRVSASYEKRLVKRCDRTVVESDKDEEYYQQLPGANVKKFAYSEFESTKIAAGHDRDKDLHFIAGGRPVDEKGFIELVKQVPQLQAVAKKHGTTFRLTIFCKEYDRATGEPKKQSYVDALEQTIKDTGVEERVEVVDKVSIRELREQISNAQGLIVPSLYDPYCLMPHYAIKENRVSFVSTHTGISESIHSEQHLFDPLDEEALAQRIDEWISDPQPLVFENTNTSHREMYLEDQWE